MDGDPFDLAGDVIDGQFRVDSFAGEGDLSVVYKGHHLGVDASVAIKFLNLPATLDPALARPLVDAFKEASRVNYRLARGNLNIAQSIASGTTLVPRTGAVIPYLVREWFEGESLASDLARRRDEKRSGRSIPEALALLETAFEAVAHAHQQGDVHLSINPSNLFLARRGGAVTLKVLDFGIARAMNGLMTDVPAATRPEGGLRVLFPAYAAPEQLDQSVGKPGPWTDVYALALVTTEVLSDRVVMAEQETGALVGHALDEKRRPTPQAHGLKLPRNLDLVLARAVARTPARRHETAAALWRDIKNAARATTSGPMPIVAVLPEPSRPETPPAVVDAGSVAPATSPLPPSVPTMPLAFEPPTVPLGPRVLTEASPAPASTPEPAESPSAVEPPAAPAPPVASTFEPLPLPRPPRPARLVVVVGAVLGAAVGISLAASLKHHASTPAARPEPKAAVTASAAPAPPPPAPEPAATEPPAPEPAASEVPTKPFSAYAARRALDGTSHDVLSCRKDKTWGVASAAVTFANDGSVSGVAVGVPFAGTATGACVSENLSAAHVPPFAGKPATLVYRFFVASK